MSPRNISAALRQRVAEAARFRCGYCLTAQRIIGPLLAIDHFIPESRGGSSDEENLWLACPMCNSHKADRQEALDPESRAMVPLFNPRAARWEEHFEWIEAGTMIRGKTPQGRATVVALQMNHQDIVAARGLWGIAGWHPPME
jgi:5-methylcytosine-specific restriction endonuclease McrA